MPIRRRASRLVAAADGCDYLVNAAGVILLKSIFEVTVEEWRRVQTVNAESIFFLCQQLGPRMKPGGAILNLSSSSAKLATTVEAGVYAASKTTITSITRSFAYALASRPVRVNCICPGIIDTPMQEAVLEKVAAVRGTTAAELSEARNKTVPLGRAASAGRMREPDLVPAFRRGELHDRPVDQLHRRNGDMVSFREVMR